MWERRDNLELGTQRWQALSVSSTCAWQAHSRFPPLPEEMGKPSPIGGRSSVEGVWPLTSLASPPTQYPLLWRGAADTQRQVSGQLGRGRRLCLLHVQAPHSPASPQWPLTPSGCQLHVVACCAHICFLTLRVVSCVSCTLPFTLLPADCCACCGGSGPAHLERDHLSR